jgi:hypothetical protein
MTLTLLEAGTTQDRPLIQKHVVPDFGRLANDHPSAMVNKETPADSGPGVDFNAGQETIELGE